MCPLRSYELPAALPGFSSYAACNNAVTAYRASATPEEADRRAEELFARLLPLVRKVLRRFCFPVRMGSRCYPGACYPEELIGESYLWFRHALDEFDPSRGLDFVGFATRRLFWDGEHRTRALRRGRHELAPEESVGDISVEESEEDRLLDRVLAESLLEQLQPQEAELARRAAEGYTSPEMARLLGISEPAVRKRLERIRERLRG